MGYADTNNSMHIRNASGNLLLQHTGTWNVAIGGTSPVSKLDVSGTITASGIVVDKTITIQNRQNVVCSTLNNSITASGSRVYVTNTYGGNINISVDSAASLTEGTLVVLTYYNNGSYTATIDDGTINTKEIGIYGGSVMFVVRSSSVLSMIM
jgi:hypothetical protein